VTLLVLAIEARNIIAVRVLVENQVIDVNLAVESDGLLLSPISLAAACFDPEEPGILNLLIDAGTDRKDRVKTRITQLILALLRGIIRVCDCLGLHSFLHILRHLHNY
jgi:hypothetical protein